MQPLRARQHAHQAFGKHVTIDQSAGRIDPVQALNTAGAFTPLLAAQHQDHHDDWQLDRHGNLRAVLGQDTDGQQTCSARQQQSTRCNYRHEAEHEPRRKAVATAPGPYKRPTTHKLRQKNIGDKQARTPLDGNESQRHRGQHAKSGHHHQCPVQAQRALRQRHHCGYEHQRRRQLQRGQDRSGHIVPPGPVGPQMQAGNACQAGLCQSAQRYRQGVKPISGVAQRQRTDQRHNGCQPRQAKKYTQNQRDALFGAAQGGLADEPYRRAHAVAVLKLEQIAAGCFSRNGNRHQGVAVRHGPAADRDQIAGFLLVPLAGYVKREKRQTVDRGRRQLHVPALGIRRGRHSKAYPQCVAGGQRINGFVARCLPFDTAACAARDLAGGALAGGVQPEIAPVIEPRRLRLAVKVQHSARRDRAAGCSYHHAQKNNQQGRDWCQGPARKLTYKPATQVRNKTENAAQKVLRPCWLSELYVRKNHQRRIVATLCGHCAGMVQTTLRRPAATIPA